MVLCQDLAVILLAVVTVFANRVIAIFTTVNTPERAHLKVLAWVEIKLFI